MFNIYNYMLAGAFVLFALIDYLWPARRFPETRWWRVRGISAGVMYFALASYSPFLWADALAGATLFNATHWPLPVAVVIGYAVSQLVMYLWHRALHKFDLLWRMFHQMHHSAERLDIYGALYLHPLDMIAFTFTGSFALTVVLGVAPTAAAMAGVLGGVISLFTHANLRTPRWLGYLIARPEVHAIHHQRGRHASNYGELTVWDQLFGTFRNPAEWDEKVGFYDGASERVVEALLWRDISVAPKSKIERLSSVITQEAA